MLPVGLSTTASTLVGMSIGAEDKSAINHFFKVLLASAAFVGITEAVLLYFARGTIICFFTKDDPEVVKQINSIWNIFLAYIIVDALSTVTSNCVRASGKQKEGAILTFFTFFCVGIPIGYFTAFEASCGLTGIQYGLFSAMLVTAVSFIAMFLLTDWDETIKQKREQFPILE